ncbi:MAG: hypothetical protein ACE5F6_12310 [Anaerolineae bacterium]
MRTHLTLPIGLAALLILVLCTVLAGQAASSSDYTLTTADDLALGLSADGQVTSLQIDGTELVSLSAPALLLRDLSQAGSITATNLLTNPGFEDGFAGWTEVLSSGPITAAVVEHLSRHGAMSQVLQFSLEGQPGHRGTIAYGSDPVPVEPGKRYRLGAWARSKQGYVSRLTGNAPNLQMRLYREITQHPNGIYVQWLDDNSKLLGEPVAVAPLVQNAQSWRLLRGEVEVPAGAASVQVAVVASLQDEETLWFDDVQLIQSPEEDDLLGGEVSWAGENHLSQAVTAHDLQIAVEYVAHDEFIAISGTVQNLRDEDRAFDLTLSLPVEAAGWRFWDDVRHARTITSGVYDQGISAVSDGWLPMSLYPYAGISGAVEQGSKGAGEQGRGGVGETRRQGNTGTRREGEEGRGRSDNPQSEIRNPKSVGLALAQNPLVPQIVWLRYDARAGALQATFHLGISPQATELQNRATFDLRLFRFDPTRGFRDVIARYGDFFPQVQRTDFPFGDYSGGVQGTIFRDDPEQMEMLRELQQQGVYLAEYAMTTEFWFPALPTAEHALRPTLPEILDVVDAFALPLSELWEEVPALSESAEWDLDAKRELAKAVYHSAVIADNGEWKLKTVAKKAYPVEHWYAIWAANMDPDLAQGLGRWTLLRRIDPVFDLTEAYDVRLDGVLLDQLVAFPVIDRRPEAITGADHTLAFSPVSYEPGVHSGFAMFEFMKTLRERLDQRGGPRAITANCWGIGHPNYLAGFIDFYYNEGGSFVTGSEGGNWSPEILDYRRALAGHKLLAFESFASDVSVETALEFTALAKLYGVNVGVKNNEGSWDPDALDIVNAAAAFVRPYALAGWEPLTYARTNSEDVWLERFGGPESPGVPSTSFEFPGTWGNSEELMGTQGGLYFAVHNHSEVTRTAAITIETTPLGLSSPDTAILADIASNDILPFTMVDGDIVVTLTLGPLDTRVLKVSECCDFNDDAQVDVVDIQMVAAAWGAANPIYDFDGSGTVDVADLTLVAGRWRR